MIDPAISAPALSIPTTIESKYSTVAEPLSVAPPRAKVLSPVSTVPPHSAPADPVSIWILASIEVPAASIPPDPSIGIQILEAFPVPPDLHHQKLFQN